jgi:hypothetical protein
MNLPNAENVEIAREKLTDYLLNPLHPDGASKAFYLAMGFTVERWEVLANALRVIAVAYPVERVSNSPHGTKYVVDGVLKTPCGKTPAVRTVWIIDHGAETPRLVTAYPHVEGD